MRNFESISDAVAALNEWFWTNLSTIPTGAAEQLRPFLGYVGSPVDTMVHCSEIIYAFRDQIGEEGLEIAAGVASLCAQSNFHGMIERGQQMSRALLRAPKKGDPAPLERWLPAKEEEELPPPPAVELPVGPPVKDE